VKPTREQLLNTFHISLTKGRCIWKNPPRTHPRLKGVEAGSLKASIKGRKPYWVIKAFDQVLLRSHIIFFIKTGKWVGLLDHRNCDSLDDRASNLRAANRLRNARNRSIGKVGRNLPMGVRAMGDGFQARISVNKKMVHLGVYQSAKEANEVYRAAREQYFGEWA
jgi:hypothetical protein